MTIDAETSGRPLTRGGRLLASVAVLGIVIFLSLVPFAERTDVSFAWTLMPPLSAVLLGGAFLSAAAMTLAARRQTYWAGARPAAVGGWVMVTATLVATVIHLDAFHLNAVTGWVWLLLYIFAPVALGALVWYYVRQSGGDPPRTAPMSTPVRVGIAVTVVGFAVLGVALWVVPWAAQIWPWTLKPLSARAIGSWLLSFAVVNALIVYDGDHIRAVPAYAAGVPVTVVALAGVLWYRDALDWTRVSPQVFVAVMAAILIAALAGLRVASIARAATAARRVPGAG